MTTSARAPCGASTSIRIGRPSRERISDIEAEKNHIAVLNFVLLPFAAHLAGSARRLLSAQFYVIVIADGFSADEAALEVAVNRARGLWRFQAATDRPGVRLFQTGGEEGLETEELV